MDIEDKELFDSALTDEAPEIEATPAEQPEPQIEGQPRDEHGRFAPKAADPEPTPAPQAVEPPAKEEVHVPSWRLREEREAREAAERRAQEVEARWQRQFAELQSRLPKQEPTPAPDVFEDPNRFLQHGVQQAVDPIKSEVQELREYYSWQRTVDKFGEEKAKAARIEFEKAVNEGDPDARAVLQRSLSAIDPFSNVMRWHQQRSLLTETGGDLGSYFDKTLDARLADPAFAGQLLQKIQQSARGAPTNPQGQPKIALPPSLSRVPSAQVGSDDDDNDMNDAALFRHASR